MGACLCAATRLRIEFLRTGAPVQTLEVVWRTSEQSDLAPGVAGSQ